MPTIKQVVKDTIVDIVKDAIKEEVNRVAKPLIEGEIISPHPFDHLKDYIYNDKRADKLADVVDRIDKHDKRLTEVEFMAGTARHVSRSAIDRVSVLEKKAASDVIEAALASKPVSYQEALDSRLSQVPENKEVIFPSPQNETPAKLTDGITFGSEVYPNAIKVLKLEVKKINLSAFSAAKVYSWRVLATALGVVDKNKRPNEDAFFKKLTQLSTMCASTGDKIPLYPRHSKDIHRVSKYHEYNIYDFVRWVESL